MCCGFIAGCWFGVYTILELLRTSLTKLLLLLCYHFSTHNGGLHGIIPRIGSIGNAIIYGPYMFVYQVLQAGPR